MAKFRFARLPTDVARRLIPDRRVSLGAEVADSPEGVPDDDPQKAASGWEWIFHLERLAHAGFMAGGLANGTLNLLTSIAGTLQLAMLERDPIRMANGIARANDLAMKAAEAMNVYLTFARWSPDSPAISACEDVVEEAKGFLDAALRASGVDVETEIGLGTEVLCDHTLLQQVVIDSIAFVLRTLDREGGHIRIVGRRTNGTVELTIAGDGPTLPDVVFRHVFDPIVDDGGMKFGGVNLGDAGDAGTAAPLDASSRTWLGLYLARRIAESHGGSLEVDSPIAGGIEVRLVMPAAPLDTLSRTAVGGRS